MAPEGLWNIKIDVPPFDFSAPVFHAIIKPAS